MLPLVSICIPTYNADKYIERTLNSIIKQTYGNIEIIVGDNASNDDTECLVNDFIKSGNSNISYYKNVDNLGYSGNCNKLISLAKGDFVAIYHSDDEYEQDIVKTQVELLLSDKLLAGCFTLFSMIDSNGLPLKKWPFKLYNKKLGGVTNYNYESYIDMILNHYCNPLFCPSSMVRKSAYIEVGGYSESITITEDQDMWVRLLNNYNLAVINEEKVKYRIHSEQGSTIYTDITRKKTSPMISHLSHHLINKHGEFDYLNKYKIKIDRLHAIDDIRLAFYSVKKEKNRMDFIDLIIKSKSKYLFKIKDSTYISYFVVQRFPSFLIFPFLKILNKVRK